MKNNKKNEVDKNKKAFCKMFKEIKKQLPAILIFGYITLTNFDKYSSVYKQLFGIRPNIYTSTDFFFGGKKNRSIGCL